MNNLTKITILFGAFSTMALSNAVVPVLNLIAADSVFQGAVFSAYFLGAFLMVFPAGWISDKIGRKPLIQIGLFGTFAVSVLLWFSFPDPLLAAVFRFLEGLFTGMFVSAALALMNSAADHKKLSGSYVAVLNVGMVAGLVLTGVFAAFHPYFGVLLFGTLSGVSALMSFGVLDESMSISEPLPMKDVGKVLVSHKWLWISMVVFCGTTGVVTSLYPDLSLLGADVVGVITAFMSVATAVTVYAFSHLSIQNSLSSVRNGGVLLAVSVPIILINPIGMILVGAVFGVITVALLNYIAETNLPQGVMNGIFYLMQYGGMAVLPFIAGVLLGLNTGYVFVFLMVAAVNLFAGLCVMKCPCYVK